MRWGPPRSAGAVGWGGHSCRVWPTRAGMAVRVPGASGTSEPEPRYPRGCFSWADPLGRDRNSSLLAPLALHADPGAGGAGGHLDAEMASEVPAPHFPSMRPHSSEPPHFLSSEQCRLHSMAEATESQRGGQLAQGRTAGKQRVAQPP